MPLCFPKFWGYLSIQQIFSTVSGANYVITLFFKVVTFLKESLRGLCVVMENEKEEKEFLGFQWKVSRGNM